jgi:hypothetical protein
MSKIEEIKKSLSQIMAAFSILGLIGGIIIMSPTGRFGCFLIMAVCALVTALAGSKRLRIFGIVAFAIGVIGTIILLGDYKHDSYFVRVKIRQAYTIGKEYTKAVTEYHSTNNVWPKSVETFTIKPAPHIIKSVFIEPNGTIKLVLPFSPLNGKSLAFAPQIIDNIATWRCTGKDIPEVYLPQECRK